MGGTFGGLDRVSLFHNERVVNQLTAVSYNYPKMCQISETLY